MLINYNKRFLKDLSAVPKTYQKKIEQFVFTDIHEIDNFSSLENAEKLVGYAHYYKIRFGTYRLGISYKNNQLTFERVLHRKEIYKFFP